jgi:hypothetical protein
MGGDEAIEFDWALSSVSADRLASILGELGVSTERHSAAPGDPDTQVYSLLQEAGLMFDQQQTSRLAEDSTVALAGSASPEAIATALYRLGEGPGSGGFVIDLMTEPAQITEVRHAGGHVVVLADAEGARQLQVNPDLIASALRRSVSSRAR